jgi:hypothetical protein
MNDPGDAALHAANVRRHPVQAERAANTRTLRRAPLTTRSIASTASFSAACTGDSETTADMKAKIIDA